MPIARGDGRPIGAGMLDRLQRRYEEILAAGYDASPEPQRAPGQKGSLKRGKAVNLLDRFRDRPEEVMAFLIYGVPFDNNQAERDLRMMKTKQKISGCFRALRHARAFVSLRSIIASARKRSLNILEIIRTTLASPGKARILLIGT